MKKLFKIKSSASRCPEFSEASAEELRVIIVIAESGGASLDEEDIAKLAGISVPRARAAIAFWEGTNVIDSTVKADGNIEEEFEHRTLDSDITELGGVEAAREIRDNELADTIEECAKLLGKPALHTEDVKKIVALHTEYGFDGEFILTLLAYVVTKSSAPTVAMLARRAKALYDKNINTVEKLDAYIKDTEEQIDGEMELRRMMGIYRPLTKTQRLYAEKWLSEYAFGLDIIGEAYDITVNAIDKASFKYMDTILASWHEGGCTTVEECRKKSELDRLKKNAEKPQGQKQKKPAATEKTRYGNFDPDEVFKKALERSYGHLEDEK